MSNVMMEDFLAKVMDSTQTIYQGAAKVMITSIDEAIKNNDRKILLDKKIVGDSIEKIISRNERLSQIIDDSVAHIGNMVNEDSVREFSKSQMFTSLIEKSLNGQVSSQTNLEHLQLRVLKDMTEGEGPFLPDTVKILEEMKSLYQANAQKALPDLSFEDLTDGDEEIEPIIAYFTLFLDTMMVKSSEVLKENLGAENIITDFPTEEQRSKVVEFVRQGVPMFEMLVEALRDESLSFDM